MKKTVKVSFLTRAAVIGGIYVILTYLAFVLGLSNFLRISEVLCVLPLFTPAAIPGLFVGCIIANMLTGDAQWSVLGSAATLIGAVGTYRLRNRPMYLAMLPPVVSNMVLVPVVLRFAYGMPGNMIVYGLTVGLGEAVCCILLGIPFAKQLKKAKIDW